MMRAGNVLPALTMGAVFDRSRVEIKKRRRSAANRMARRRGYAGVTFWSQSATQLRWEL